MTTTADHRNPNQGPSGYGDASESLGQRLFRSHLTIGAIGAAMLLLAIGTTVWVRWHTDRVANKRIPISHAATRLLMGAERSLSALRGWVVLGESSFKEQRADIWKEQIRPTMILLDELLGFSENESEHTDVAALTSSLEDLSVLQWRIEDIAQSPGNEPASELCSRVLDPTARLVYAQITALIDMEKAEPASRSRKQLLAAMADFRGVSTYMWRSAQDFVASAHERDAHEFNARSAVGQEHLGTLKAARDMLTLDQCELLSSIEEEFASFVAVGERAISLRRSRGWNVARQLLSVEAGPLERNVQGILQRVSDRQRVILQSESHAAALVSTAAIAISCALVPLTLILSAYVARRSTRRVMLPVEALTRATERMARRELHENIPVVVNDELGQLTKSFNLMRQSLSDAERDIRYQKLALDEHSIVAITDVRGRITYANEKFCQISQYRSDELMGKDHRIVNSGHHPKSFFRNMWGTLRAGRIWKGEVKNRAKDGSWYWVDTTIVPIGNPSGDQTRYIAVRTDITEHKETERQLMKSKEAAEAANRAKSEFLANMSHEIRTPMTAILGFSETLLDGDIAPSEMLGCVRTIQRNGEYLLDLINNILDLSKIEAEKMEIEHIDCSPCRIVADVIALMCVRSDAKGLTLDIEYIGPFPETIRCDPTRLRQILINLLGNSIKFTESGSVRLVMRFVAGANESSPQLRFDVVDTGRGMTDEQVNTLFEAFTQADNSMTRKFGGTGLGLTICKRFAALLGGDVTIAKTAPGVGTTVRLTIAADLPDGAIMLDDPVSATVVGANEVAPHVARTDLKDSRVLLAEDGPDNQRLIGHVLRKAGADVTVVENGKLAHDVALEACGEDRPFDVILMDMQMPVMDGYEATRSLRDAGYSGTIIALTAHAMATDRKKCTDVGCDDYATKPIDRNKLIEIIGTHLDRGHPAPTTV